MAEQSTISNLTKEQLIEFAGQIGLTVDPSRKVDELKADIAPNASPEAVADYQAEIKDRADKEAAAKAEAEKAAEAADDDPKGSKKYYRSRIAGLEVVIKPAKVIGDEAKTVRFTPFLQRWDGDMTKIGYLETDSLRAQAILKDDPNVELIDKKDYDEVFKKAADDSNPNVVRSGY